MISKHLGFGTMFRDSMIWNGTFIGQINRYFRQIEEQVEGYKRIEKDNWKIVALEGDSKDNTREILEQKQKEYPHLKIIEHSGNPNEVMSSGSDARIKELSNIGNKVLAELTDCEFVFWCESDLILYDMYILEKMMRGMKANKDWGVIGGMVHLDTYPHYFYDTWAYRDLDGIQFTNLDNWHPSVLKQGGRYIELGSLGSCCLIRGELLQQGCTFEDGALPRLCYKAIEKGYKIILDRACTIYHPSNQLEKFRWI